MKSKLLLIALAAVALIGCKNQQAKTTQTDAPEYAVVTPTKLVESIANYQDAKVEMEGMVNHVCRSGGKMKMMADDGAVVFIFPKDTEEKYDASLERKIIKVYGVASSHVVESDHACSHDTAEEKGDRNHAEHEGCEHEKAEAKPIIMVTAERYEIVGDADAE
ncbi:MAG: hypothetical protein LBG19_13345 [Prevotellaceae bacterium]|jgi:hypothetical protein|nr:hypothetical protein [Prevotellaceae bacterium]